MGDSARAPCGRRDRISAERRERVMAQGSQSSETMDGAWYRGRGQRAARRRATPYIFATSATHALLAHTEPTEFPRTRYGTHARARRLVEQLRRPARYALCAPGEIAIVQPLGENRMYAAGSSRLRNFNFFDVGDSCEMGGEGCPCRNGCSRPRRPQGRIWAHASVGVPRFACQGRAGHRRDHLPPRRLSECRKY